MSAPFIDLADAIAEDLTTFAAGTYTAKREYVPNWTAKATEALACAVVASNHESELISRVDSKESPTIDVGFTKCLQAQTRDEIDGLALIVHAAFLRLKPNGTVRAFELDGVRYRAVRATYKAIYDPDRLTGKGDGAASGQFLSVFSVTYQAFP